MSLRTANARRERRVERLNRPPSPQLGMALIIAAVCTGLAAILQGHIHNANLAMVYLLGVVVAAVRFGPTAAVANAAIAVAAFDFFFVPPAFNFKPTDSEYYVTLPVMLVVALTVARLAAGLRQQAELAAFREQRMSELNELSRELAATADLPGLCVVANRHLNTGFDGLARILLPDEHGQWQDPAVKPGAPLTLADDEYRLAQLCFERQRATGRLTHDGIGADARFEPLRGAGGTVGVLMLRLRHWERLQHPEILEHLEIFATQIALALERAVFAMRAEKAHVDVEREQLRNSLLAAISHDLRTPLATIFGAATGLETMEGLNDHRRRELAGAIVEETRHITELVTKVLDMARFQSGGLKPQREWLVLDEVIASVLTRLRERRSRHCLAVALAPELGLLHADPMLLERVLYNLVDNALKYAPEGSLIRIDAERRADAVEIRVTDNGPGLPEGREETIFEKFVQLDPERKAPGVGLGLAICRVVVEAHGGKIWAGNSQAGGAIFTIRLPQAEIPPDIADEQEES